MTPRRHVARVVALVSLGVVASWRLAAQVGHDAARSPFRDIPRGSGPLLTVGYGSGDRGIIDVGLGNVTTIHARYDLGLSGPTRFTFGLGYGRGDRFVVDRAKDTTQRKTGPVADDVFFVDGGLQFLLTGRKTWHGLAPYVAATIGLAFGGAEPKSEPGAYEFGAKVTVAPGVGVRWYPRPRLNVQADARVLLWRLGYPVDYLDGRVSPDSIPELPPNAQLTEWTRHRWVSLGVAWTF